MYEKLPKVSCICITNNRVHLLLKAINCFLRQDYQNKQLVISYPEDDENTDHYITTITKDLEIKILSIKRPIAETLGSARNTAVATCDGDYICIWDDDDWYHPLRLSYQLNKLREEGTRYHASVLMRIILYDQTNQKSYISFPYTWDGTLLCRKEVIMANQYTLSNKGEDTHTIRFLESKQYLHHIYDAPFLYIYTYHGTNTWNYDHFKYFLTRSELISGDTANIITKAVQQ